MRLAAVTAVLTLGVSAATFARADDEPPSTVTVERTVEGLTVDQWRYRAVRNRRWFDQEKENSAKRATTIKRLRHTWRPTVDYALTLASRVFSVPYWKLRAVAACESTLNPSASNGRYRGLLQLGWSPYGFSPFDPVASALSTAQTVRRDGSWRQWECG